MEVVKSPDEYVRICEDLGNVTRFQIYEILEKVGEIKAWDLVEELKKRGLEITYSGILNHLRKMQTNSGLVELFEKEGKIHVKLKKKVKIEVEDL